MLLLIYFIICLFILYWVIQVPIKIAENRGITGSELNTISLLSWCGVLFVGVTWFVALVLSLIWQPKEWIDKSSSDDDSLDLSSLQKLEKLAELKEKNIISEDEFNIEKKKLLMR